MTTKNWYLDGALISQGSMDYTWTITAGGHTIRFTGSNANGSVSQQWDINGGLGGNVAGTSAHVNLTPIPNAVVLLYTQAGTLYNTTQSGADGAFQWNVNGDGEINLLDMYSVILDGLDLNNDGKVDTADVFMVSGHLDIII